MPGRTLERPWTAPTPAIYVGRPPRPRATNNSWSNRNRSNILPSEPEGLRSRQTTRQTRRRPWKERGASHGVFENPTNPDINNNPTVPVAHRPPWPWQERARTSSAVLNFGRQNENPMDIDSRPVSQRRGHKWPWQERALQSKIFELPEEKPHIHRSYEWDQRKAPFFAVQESLTKGMEAKKSTSKIWPWQEKARTSSIFKPADKLDIPTMKYPWDQRQSTFDVKVNHASPTKFLGESWYKGEFIKKEINTSRGVEAAGKSCYGTLKYQKGPNRAPSEEKVAKITEFKKNRNEEKNSISKDIRILKDTVNNEDIHLLETHPKVNSMNKASEENSCAPSMTPSKASSMLRNQTNEVCKDMSNLKIVSAKEKVQVKEIIERKPLAYIINLNPKLVDLTVD